VIEMGKEYRTRDGRSVRVHTTTAQCNLGPVIGEYESGGNWVLEAWDCGGVAMLANSNLDLIEVKPVRVLEMWVNVYPRDRPSTHMNPHHADNHGAGRIACLHIRQEYTEGDGLCGSEKT
jgi:hypothetical protein